MSRPDLQLVDPATGELHGCDHIPGQYSDSAGHLPLAGQWTLPQLAREVGVEYRTAKLWENRGIISASVKTAKGSGHPAAYNDADVERARNAADLRRAGVEAAALERIGDDLADTGHWQTVAAALRGEWPGG